jgi:hypothetical protein
VAYYQDLLFDWVATRDALTSALILAAGFVAALQGFRFQRFLLAICAMCMGYIAGSAVAVIVHTPEMLAGVIGAFAAGLVALALPGPAMVATSGATWAVLGAYLADHVGLKGLGSSISLVLGGGAGIALAFVSRKQMVVLLTSLLGAAAIVVGFVGLANVLVPAVGMTFRSWAHCQSPAVPIFFLMITMTVYSYQASAKQGNLYIGGHSDRPTPAPRVRS